jgi:hypothetical protein
MNFSTSSCLLGFFLRFQCLGSKLRVTNDSSFSSGSSARVRDYAASRDLDIVATVPHT